MTRVGSLLFVSHMILQEVLLIRNSTTASTSHDSRRVRLEVLFGRHGLDVPQMVVTFLTRTMLELSAKHFRNWIFFSG